jgi:hypothetical protein
LTHNHNFYETSLRKKQILIFWQEDDGESIEPGGPAGFATVVKTDKDSSTLVIHRQWRPFYSDAWIVEHPYPL